MYLCERCKIKEALSKQRYCSDCKKIVKKELYDCGYLQRIGDSHCGQRRTGEAKENTYQTKHGTGH